MRNKKVIIFILILVISIGFALVSATLGITTNARFLGGKFEVKIVPESVQVLGDSDANINIISISDDEIEFSSDDLLPEQKLQFSFKVENSGTIDAMLSNYNLNFSGLEDNVSMIISYADETNLKTYDLLKVGSSEIYIVTVDYHTLMESTVDGTYTVNINFQKANGNAVDRHSSVDNECPEPVSFADDSWTTIACNVRKGNTDAYPLGATKEVLVGGDRFSHIRVANKTYEGLCGTEEFSETACGFVLEFANAVADRAMHIEYTNVGGWRDAELREYLNTMLIEELPDDLKNEIVETKVISGHGSTSGENNFVTYDKLYLLSPQEIYYDDTGFDTAYGTSRQLDYYTGTTTTDYTKAIKTNTSWLLRTAGSYSDSGYFHISADGSYSYVSSTNTMNISPAFRLG